MASSNASTVAQYLRELPKPQRDELQKVRTVITQNLGKGFKETMNWGMISYEVPLATYPKTYNKKPLLFAALAAQKNNFSLYLMCVYQSPGVAAQLHEAFRKSGKKPNMGKSCIRFKSTEDIPLNAIGKIIKSVTLKKFIAAYEAVKGN